MSTYRVGAEGATVFDEGRKFVFRLRPGYVVVQGSLDTPGSLADQHRKAKQQRGYADKVIRPAEDKSYLVGESGPETFIPHSPGTINPHKDQPK